MIPTVKFLLQQTPPSPIIPPNHPVKINQPIKHPRLPYPPIHPLSRPLSFRIRVRLHDGRIRRCPERRDRRSDHLYPCRMQSRDDLFVGHDDSIAYYLLRGGGGRCCADVVDALEDDRVRYAGVCEHVAVDAREGVWAEGVVEESVAAGGLVEEGEGRCC